MTSFSRETVPTGALLEESLEVGTVLGHEAGDGVEERSRQVESEQAAHSARTASARQYQLNCSHSSAANTS